MPKSDNEVKALLANQWLSELLSPAKNDISLDEKVADIEKELRTGKIARMYENLTLKNEEDRQFLDVVALARAMRAKNFEEASKIKMRLLGIKEE